MRKSKRIAVAGDYEKAIAILDQVPKTFHNDEFRNFRDQIADLAYLAWDIQYAPRLMAHFLNLPRNCENTSPITTN